jgi:hypothetical protein
MKQSNNTFLIRSVALAGAATFLPLVACSSEPSPSPLTTASTTETTDPDNPSSGPGGSHDAPSTPTGNAGPTSPADCKLGPNDVCSPSPQCGCSPTQTCDIVNTKGTTACVTAGNAPMGKPCTATAGCALGLTCLFGTCHAFCDAKGTCSQPGAGACLQVQTEDGADVPNLRVCQVACELQDPNSCGGKTNAGVGACYSDGKGGTDCQEGGTHAENEKCSQEDKCGPGLVCVNTSSSSSCKRWCRLGHNDCGGTAKCAGFSNEVKVGNVVYGACP